MPPDRRIIRISDTAKWLVDTNLEYVRAVLAEGRRVLAEPCPDTFLGRKTHEPFPKGDNSQGRYPK